VPESRCEDLEEASDEVSLKLALWEGRTEFDDLVVQWKQTHFDSLDMTAFEDNIAKYVYKPVFHGVPSEYACQNWVKFIFEQ
jgi:hypothetical protein